MVLPAAQPRAVDSVQTRQSSAERDVFAERQGADVDAAAAAASSVVETCAEGAVVVSCDAAREVLGNLWGMQAGSVAALMVSKYH